MANVRTNEIEKILSDDEPTLLFDILVRDELDIKSRYKILKQYHSIHGMKMLEKTLSYVMEMAAKDDVNLSPYQDSKSYDHHHKPNQSLERVIEDLKANIRIARLSQLHRLWHTTEFPRAAQHLSSEGCSPEISRK